MEACIERSAEREISIVNRIIEPCAESSISLDEIHERYNANDYRWHSAPITRTALREALAAAGIVETANGYGAKLRPTRDLFRETRRARVAFWESRGLLDATAPSNVIAFPTRALAPSAPTSTKLFEFQNAGWDAPLPPIVWSIDGVIGEGDVGMLLAHGNSLKTWVALSMGIAKARGRAWLDRFNVGPPCRVAILDFESGDREVTRRCQLLGIDGVKDRLFRASYPAGRLHDPRAWVELADAKFGFIVVDSFSKCGDPNADENDKRIAIPLQLAGEFAERTKATVLFIHHSNKSDKKDRRERARGSTAIYADVDWSYEFVEVEKRAGGIVRSTMRTTKDGAGRAPEPIRLELSDSGLRYFEEPKTSVPPPVTSDAAPEDLHERIRLVVATQGSVAGAVELGRLVGVNEKRASTAIKLLRENGALVRGRNRRLYSGDVDAQRRRVLEAVNASHEPGGRRICSVTLLAGIAAAQRHVVEDMIRSVAITRSDPESGYFFVPSEPTERK